MAGVATRQSNTSSPHLSAKSVTASPKSNRSLLQNQDLRKDSSATQESQTTTPPRSDAAVPTINQPGDTEPAAKGNQENVAPATNAPLAPPPRPTQTNENGDYFSGQHNQTHLSKEPNPFENAFGNPAETPGKPQLPGVTSLTSPASLLLPGNTPGWPGSLRSGPLSPAMLTGPTGSNDYFNSDHHFAGSFPTPNESSLRTGLTPGGGGSMFPQPSPNSQAIFQQLQNGGATPGTLDFHRTAMNARANSQFNMQHNGATSQPGQNPNIQPDLDSKPYIANSNQPQQEQQDPFSSHQTNDAANGLFMLAQAGGQRNGQRGFAVPQQPPQQYAQGLQQRLGQQHPQDNAPNTNKHGDKNSIGSTMSGSGQEGEYDSGDSSQAKPQTRASRGKKGSGGKAAANGRRKAEDKGQNNKRQKANNGQAMQMSPEMDEQQAMDMEDEIGADGKKMTDEEKRKNFLERNRVAALKCRQRKKQWLSNLQQKVEIFSTENDALAATVTQLREEIVGLKTLLLAHKDCPVSQAQGISGLAMQQIAGDSQQYANPYGMAMGPHGVPQGGMPPQANMQRR